MFALFLHVYVYQPGKKIPATNVNYQAKYFSKNTN